MELAALEPKIILDVVWGARAHRWRRYLSPSFHIPSCYSVVVTAAAEKIQQTGLPSRILVTQDVMLRTLSAHTRDAYLI
jgi:hypothetical protein